MARRGSRLALVATLALSATSASALEPKKPSQLVSLTSSGFCGPEQSGILYGRRILPDGTDTPFAIPNGQVLVVTRVGYRFKTDNASVSSEFLVERDGAPWWLARVPLVFGTDGYALGIAELAAVVGAGGQVCVRGPGAPQALPELGFVEGYLTKAK